MDNDSVIKLARKKLSERRLIGLYRVYASEKYCFCFADRRKNGYTCNGLMIDLETQETKLFLPDTEEKAKLLEASTLIYDCDEI